MRKMNTFEMSIAVAGEVYTSDESGVADYLKSQVLREVHLRQGELDGEIEIIVHRDEKRDQYTLRATGRAWTGEEETQGPVDMCPYCGQEGLCPCGDQATAPTAQEIMDALPDVEAIL